MKKILIFLSVFIFTFYLNVIVMNAYGWGFSKNDNHEQPSVGKYADEIKDTSSYFVGSSAEKNLYLTFDAGYDNGNLEKIVDILKEKEVTATFFITGDFIELQPQKVKYIYDNNQVVGNHTYSHKCINKISVEELTNEIQKVEKLYFDLIGEEMVKQFRPPKGEFDKQSLINVQKLGYNTFFWSIAYKDWETNNQRGSDYAYNSVMDNLHNGAIILMHTVSNDNVEALSKIIDSCIEQGYSFKGLDSLIES